MKYKYLLFDLDNTLVDDNMNRKYAISRVLDFLRRDYDDEVLENFVRSDNEYWKKMVNKEFEDIRPANMTKEETFQWAGGNRIRYFLDDLSFNTCVKLNNLYMGYMKERIFPFEGVRELLDELKEKGYLIYVITNGPEKAAYRKMESISDNVFTDMLASETIGIMKPSAEYYEAMYSKFNINDKDKMLVIGDELEKDILGGINQGIDTAWINLFEITNTSDIVPTYEISSVKELKRVL